MTDKCIHCKIDLPPEHFGPCPNCGVVGEIAPLKIKVKDAISTTEVTAREIRGEKIQEVSLPEKQVSSPVYPGIIELSYPLREKEFNILTRKFRISTLAASLWALSLAWGIKILAKYIRGDTILDSSMFELYIIISVSVILSIISYIFYRVQKRPITKRIKNHFKKQEEQIDEQQRRHGRLS
jgi:uncharacterized membrane protein YciS (DUF1049 family)